MFSFLGSLLIDGSSSRLQVDIVSGDFLINGHPVGRLPEAIVSHSDFYRLFNRTIFVVQPAAGGTGRFVTQELYHGAKYTFALDKEPSKYFKTSRSSMLAKYISKLLVIERHAESGETFQLLPHKELQGIAPHLLVENYNHWFKPQEKIY